MKALEELGIRPVGYAGTSSGAIVAAFAAAGLPADAVSNMFFKFRNNSLNYNTIKFHNLFHHKMLSNIIIL